MSNHLFLVPAWWATLRVPVEVRPVEAATLRVGRLRVLARAETGLFWLLPRALWLSWHVRALRLLLRILPGVLERLAPAPPGRPWTRLLAAVEDLERVGHEALPTTRRLRETMNTGSCGGTRGPP